MELVEITLTPLQRRNRAAFVTFDDLGRQQLADQRPQRMLAERERVVLRDETGEYYGGTVIDTLQVTPDVDSYLIRVGVRLPEEWALLRLGKLTVAEVQAGAVDQDTTAEVLDLLDLLRGQAGDDLPRGTDADRRTAP